MKSLIFSLCLILTVVVTSQTAVAKKVTYRKTQSVDFSETNIDGVARTPDGAYLHQKRGIKFLPLYDVKKQFDSNIKSSVEYLK